MSKQASWESNCLKEQFWSSPMFWNVFFEGAIILNFWFMVTYWCGCCFMLLWLPICKASVYSYLYVPILSLFLSVHTCMNVKTSKVLIFFCCWKHYDMNTKSWIVIFSTIYLGLYGSVAKQISHLAFTACREKSSNRVRSRFFT